MAKPRVYFTRQVHDEAVAILKDRCDIQIWNSDEVVPREELLKKVKGMNAIFCTISDKIDKDVLDAAGPSLKIVSTMSVGTLHINKFECRKRNILISNTPDVAADSAAEFTVTLLLMVARRCLEGAEAVANGEWGKWRPMWICGTEIVNRTLCILGFGRVGFGVARRLKPFGVSRILYHDVEKQVMADDLNAEFVDKETLFKEADFLIISCALTGATEKMINKSVFDMMKPSAILINTSRGPVVKTDDLVDALKAGKIAGAGLDVTDPQPLPPDHPLVKMDHCIVTPHLATNSTKARLAMAINCARNIEHFFFYADSEA